MLIKDTRYEKILWLGREIINEIFKISLIAYLLLYLLNDFFTGFVTDYFNLDIILWVTIISGILTAWLSAESENETRQSQPASKKEYIFITFLSLTSIGLIYYRIQAIGRLAYVIALISGVIIFLLSILLINNYHDNKEKNHEI